MGRRLDRMGVSQDATWPNGSSVALVIVGLALFWQFLRHTNLMALFMPVTVGSAIVMPDDWASLFYAIALVLALVGAEFLSHVARKPLAVLALGATASCCAVGLQITCRVFSETIAPEAITACQLIESSLYAMVLCVLAIVWSLYCGHANMHPRWMLLSLLGSSFTGIVLAAIIFKPLPDKGLLSSFLPLLACLLGARASRSIMRTEGLQSQQVMRDMPTRARARHAMTARLTVPGGDIPATHVTRQARISMIVFITVLVISTCAKAVFDTLLADASLGELLQVKDAVTVAVIALIMATAMLMGGLERFLLTGWVVLSLALVLSLLITPLAGESTLSQIGVALSSATRVSCEAFILAAVMLRGHETWESLGRTTLHCLLVPELAGCLVGYGVLPFAIHHIENSATIRIETISLAIGISLAALAFVIVLTLALKLMRHDESAATVMAPSATAEDLTMKPVDSYRRANAGMPSRTTGIDEQAKARGVDLSIAGLVITDEQIIRSFMTAQKLTERELVIARYLLCGYSAAKIAELECVTTNTVNSQTRSLYRKLDVHSRQQLIDLVRNQTA